MSVGGHTLTAVFTPTDTASTGSTSDAVAYDITAAVEPEKPTPAVSVFLADGVTAYTGQPLYDGDTVVVKGSGFEALAVPMLALVGFGVVIFGAAIIATRRRISE